MRRYFKTLSIAFAFILLFGVFINHSPVDSYGNENSNTIEVNTYVNTSGNNTKGDPMFSEGLWAPGVRQSGVMRITNNYSQRIRVNNLALKMDLEKQDGTTVNPGSALYETYAKSMKLTIEKGRLLVFSQTLYDESFYEMLFEQGNANYQGYELPSTKQFNVSKNDSVDLKYTITMDGAGAGNDLQGLKATVDFMVNLHENLVPSGTGNEGKDHDTSDEEELVEELVEEPIFIVPDISGHWAEDCILRLIREGIIVGYPDGTIKPENTITRAETAVIVAKALKLEKKDRLFSGYLDPIPKWARGYIIATTDQGAFRGYPTRVGNVFRADRFITRQEMATVLMKGFKIDLEEDVALNFADQDDIGDWALEYVKAGVQNSIISGYPDNTFKPKDDITRAEAFVMICKLLGYNEVSEE